MPDRLRRIWALIPLARDPKEARRFSYALGFLSAISCYLVGGSAAHAANGTLRNPAEVLMKMCPEAVSYRAVYHTVSPSALKRVSAAYGSDLGISDLGVHTCYLARNQSGPFSILHGRWEIGECGIVEMIWEFDMEFRVRDFRIVRSRDTYTHVLESPQFREQLIGRDLEGLRRLVSDNNTKVSVQALGVPSAAHATVLMAVTSGIKAALITKLVFTDVMDQSRQEQLLLRTFPQPAKIRSLKALAAASNESQATRSQSLAVMGDPPQVLRGEDSRGAVLGWTVRTHLATDPGRGDALWAIDSNGRVRDVWVLGDFSEQDRNAWVAARTHALAALAEASGDEQTESAVAWTARAIVELMERLQTAIWEDFVPIGVKR